jgi:hypothetical protein
MVKRLVAAPLWLLSMWWGYSLAAYALGLPSDGGIVVGAFAAALVVLDPTGVFWGAKSRASSSARPTDGLGATASTR